MAPIKTQAARKQFVLDTNVLIHDPSALFNFEEHDVVIPMTVLEELDHIKDSQKGNHQQVNREARLAIQHIDKVVNGNSPDDLRLGISIGPGLGNLRIIMEPDVKDVNALASIDLDISVPDNRIILTALYLMQDQPLDQISTVLVTKDINMRLKAKAAGVIFVEDYKTDQVLSDINYLSPGYMVVQEDWLGDQIECKKMGKSQFTFNVPLSDLDDEIRANLYPNFSFIQDDSVWMVKSIQTDHVIFVCHKVDALMNMSAFGVKPRNIEQALAMHAALSEDVDIAFFTGPAGTGKTLIALAAALEMVIEQKRFTKIIVTRSVTDLDEGIGFLPGTEEEKMLPWLSAFTDSLEFLVKGLDDQAHGKLVGADAWAATFGLLQKKANIQFKSLNFMRGRSLGDALIILDESQNLSAHQMRSMITRTGPGSKMLCLGNLSQLDSRYLTALTSGLTVSVEKFKAFPRSANVMLKGGVRSAVATYAEEVF